MRCSYGRVRAFKVGAELNASDPATRMGTEGRLPLQDGRSHRLRGTGRYSLQGRRLRHEKGLDESIMTLAREPPPAL